MLSFRITTMLTVLSLFLGWCVDARVFTFTMHHRYSEPVKKWSHTAAGIPSPEKGTVEYYAELADRDRFLRGRKLSQFDPGLAFSDGNSTFRISSLGLYATLSLSLSSPFSSLAKINSCFELKENESVYCLENKETTCRCI